MPVIQPTQIQATEVTYELHSLGWKAFQQLCVTIVSDIWGQHVQSFFDSHDGGRDGAFRGTWKSGTGQTLNGSFTVQCKFTASSGKQLKPKDIDDELQKARRLAARGLANNYFLFTNAKITGSADEQLKSEFELVPGINHFAAYGSDRISMFIRESSRLRMLVPRVYGLGDLSQILDDRAYHQAIEILSSLGDDLGKFVITDAYQESARALAEHGFVLLLGEPACGKSTIAAALAVGAVDEWGCSTIKIRDADDFVKHSNPHESKQFFWIDDAFGATQLDWQETIRWNKTFPHIQAAIRRGAKIVFTSRDYIYRMAKNLLKQSALPVLRDSQVVIRVEKLSKAEKEQIIYNHIRLGKQPLEFKRQIKGHLPYVAAHSGFTPEIARRLGNPAFTHQIGITRSSLENFVEHPMDFLKEVLQTLDDNSRSAIALIFMRDGDLQSPVTLSASEEQAIRLQGGDASEVRNALVALDGSLVLQVLHDGCYSWRLKHPTIRDAFAALIAENRELLDIYLAGTPISRLYREISCGELGIPGVKVVIPFNRYQSVLDRIKTHMSRPKSERADRDRLNSFLAIRCDRSFLVEFLHQNPAYLADLRMGSYLSVVSDVPLVVRLKYFGLLPEPERLRHVERIQELSVETPDADFLREDIKGLFSGTELEDTLEIVRSQLLPVLSERVDEWECNHDGEEDPDSYFDLLKSALSDYRDAFRDDVDSICLIDIGLDEIRLAIARLESEMPGEPNDDRESGSWSARGSSVFSDERSVFEDVDR